MNDQETSHLLIQLIFQIKTPHYKDQLPNKTHTGSL